MRLPRAGEMCSSSQAPKTRQLPAWVAAEAERRETQHRCRRRPPAGRSHGRARPSASPPSSTAWPRGPAPAGRSTGQDLEAMIADTSEEAVWGLADALAPAQPVRLRWLGRAARRAGRGRDAADLPGRQAPARGPPGDHRDRGWQARQGGRGVAADAPVRREDAGAAGPAAHRSARSARPRCAMADLEWWTRGGSDYPEEVALTLAVRRAAGARA